MRKGLICLTLVSLTSPLTAQPPRVPVPMAADETYGPCSTAYVYGLERPGDVLAVRAGPSTRYRELARLANGRNVFACIRRGNWFGIVFDPAGRSDCQVLEPRRVTSPSYTGPCRSGWVYERYLGGYSDWISP